MKRFIIGFIITILFIAFAIGQCNGTTSEGDSDIVSLYSYTEENNEREELLITNTQEIAEEREKDTVLMAQTETLLHLWVIFHGRN